MAEANETPEDIAKKEQAGIRLEKVLTEIVTTEESYTQAMNTLLNMKEELLSEYDKFSPKKGELTKKEFAELLNKFQKVKDAKTGLDEAIKNSNIADYAKNIQNVQYAYAGYIDTFKKLLNPDSPAVAKIIPNKLTEASATLQTKAGIAAPALINAQLIQPVQRLPRYVMLANELIKSMKITNDPNLANAMKFQEAAMAATDLVNRTKVTLDTLKDVNFDHAAIAQSAIDKHNREQGFTPINPINGRPISTPATAPITAKSVAAKPEAAKPEAAKPEAAIPAAPKSRGFSLTGALKNLIKQILPSPKPNVSASELPPISNKETYRNIEKNFDEVKATLKGNMTESQARVALNSIAEQRKNLSAIKNDNNLHHKYHILTSEMAAAAHALKQQHPTLPTLAQAVKQSGGGDITPRNSTEITANNSSVTIDKDLSARLASLTSQPTTSARASASQSFIGTHRNSTVLNGFDTAKASDKETNGNLKQLGSGTPPQKPPRPENLTASSATPPEPPPRTDKIKKA